MRTAEKASSSPFRRAASLAAFHDGDGVVYVTDGAESDDRRPSVAVRPSPSASVTVRPQTRRGAAAEFALLSINPKPKRRFVRCPKDETAEASSE